MTGFSDPNHSENIGVDMRRGVKISLRDGIRLDATLYLPERHCKPSPAIFTLTPYVGQTYHGYAEYFAAHGYPFLTVDVRGRGDSEGTFKPYVNEAADGHDVVEWVARQPWCNGQVAMWGGSYAGLDQWSTAREFPSHLATIVPVASPYMGVDVPMRNNIASPYLMQWLTLVTGRASQDQIFADQRWWNRRFRRWFESGAAFQELDSQVGMPSIIFQEWLSHPQQDTYWDSYNPTAEHYARISIPILTITGIYDGDQPGALKHYREHRRHASAEASARHFLVIGPWDHAGTRHPQSEFGGLRFGPASLVDLRRLHLEWYAWTMQGGPTPEFLQKSVAYYVTGAEKWRYADSLEEITSEVSSLFLASVTNPVDVFTSGYLLLEGPSGTGGPDHYVYDPCDVSLAELESQVDPETFSDQRLICGTVGGRLIYHSVPFPRAVEIGGFFKLSVWLSIDQPDTDFVASVYEIDINGASTLLTNDWIRARYRDSLREEKLIQTSEPLHYVFDRFMFVARRLDRGSRLRLVIGPNDTIHSQRNFNSGGAVSAESARDARAVSVKLFHDVSHPSVLYVPIGQPEGPM